MMRFIRRLLISLSILALFSSPALSTQVNYSFANPLIKNQLKDANAQILRVQSGLFSYSIDLGVWRKREDANEHIENMKKNHPVLKKYKFYVKKLDLYHWGSGIVHRIRIGYMKTLGEAEAVCSSLREDGYRKKCQTQFDPGEGSNK